MFNLMIMSAMLAFSPAPSALEGQEPAKTTLPGATNVTRVDAVVMCGGATTNAAFPELKQQGFASVINLRRETEPGADIPGARKAASEAGLKYVHIPVDPAKPDEGSVKAFLSAVSDSANQPMYIHCASANRVAAMWLVKRVVLDGWDVERATAEATAIGLTSAPLKQFAIEYATSHQKK
jgi:uncharacterized protein (TIGR01244 family)